MPLLFAEYFRSSTAPKPPQTSNHDHVVFIDETDKGHQIRTCNMNKIAKKFGRCGLIADFLLCILITMFWIIAFSLFVRFNGGSSVDKPGQHDYFYFGCFIILMVVSTIGLHIEGIVWKGFQSFTPRVFLVLNNRKQRQVYVLRMRVAGDDDIVETDVDASKLTYNDILEVCCKELKLNKNDVVCITKSPHIKVRNDGDVKRFNRLEYLEIVTKQSVSVY